MHVDVACIIMILFLRRALFPRFGSLISPIVLCIRVLFATAVGIKMYTIPCIPVTIIFLFKLLLATVYGNGVYFALDASYSARSTYSPADLLGFRYMYLTRVLVGEYTVGRRGLLTPPAKNQNDPTDTYDSVVDQNPNPAIFVVFYDWQCYPEYLITFQ